MKIKIGVIFGGRSVEHEISIITANQTINSINKEKYEIIPIYISKKGLMYTGEELLELKSYRNLDELLKKLTQVTIVNDGEKINIVRFPMKNFGKNIINTIDIAFPTMHGTNGEDGTISGYLEMLNIPYIGCDILSASVGMDKIMMRRVLKEAKIPSLDYIAFYATDYIKEEEKYIRKVEEELRYPVIVKAGNLGSSVGIKKAKNTDSLREATHLYTSLAASSQINEMYSLGGLCQTELLSPVEFAEMAQKYAGEYMDLFDEYMGFVKQLCNSKQHIFTPYNSVKNFCSTGQCSGTLSVLFPPFDPEMRLQGLKNFASNLETTDISILSENFVYPNSIVMELYNHRILHIIHVGENLEISFIAIRESSICEAFETFFQSLNASEYHYEKEIQDHLIHKTIRELERNSKNSFFPHTLPDNPY